MAMIGYVARVLTGVRFKKMNHMIDVVHQKCGQNKVRSGAPCATARGIMITPCSAFTT